MRSVLVSYWGTDHYRRDNRKDGIRSVRLGGHGEAEEGATVRADETLGTVPGYGRSDEAHPEG